MGRLLLLGFPLLALGTVAWRAHAKHDLPSSPAAHEREAPADVSETPAPARPRTLWQPLAPAPTEEHASGVSGIVVDASGAPARALVAIEPPDGSWHQGRIARDGSFRFDVPPGRYRLHVVDEPGETLELELGRGERLEGIELRLDPHRPPPPTVQTSESDDIPDQLDKCPDEPDDTFEDIDGCPEPARPEIVDPDVNGPDILD
jgi:hypothetical protein